MSTITLPNIRVSSDLTVRVRLKDGGVAIDWSTLTGVKAYLYADEQRSIASRCAVSVDEEDSTLLVCQYAASKPQYLGVNRIIVCATYMGETKNYDKPALNFVRWTADQAGEQITIDDPDVDVDIEVDDVSSSILDEAIRAAINAAERAEAAAEAAEHMVDIHTGPEGKSAYEVAVEEGYTGTEEEWLASLKGDTGETPDISIGTVTTVEPGTPAAASMTGTPEDPVLNLSIPKGLVGATPNFTVGTVTTGEPGSSVIVTITGTPEAPVLNLTIPQGMQGNTGSSVDYPYELVNNLTTNDATKGLSAAQGVVLDGKVTQLEAEVDELALKQEGGSVVQVLSIDTTYSSKYMSKQYGGAIVSSSSGAAVSFYRITKGRKYIISVPKSCNNAGYVLGYSDRVANNLSGSEVDEFSDTTGASSSFSYTINEAANHSYLIVCYTASSGTPTVTEYYTVEASFPSKQEFEDLTDDVEEISADITDINARLDVIGMSGKFFALDLSSINDTDNYQHYIYAPNGVGYAATTPSAEGQAVGILRINVSVGEQYYIRSANRYSYKAWMTLDSDGKVVRLCAAGDLTVINETITIQSGEAELCLNIHRYGFYLIAKRNDNARYNPLAGKLIAFDGSSSCEARFFGNSSNGGSYPYLLARKFGIDLINKGKGGATVATGTSASHHLAGDIANMPDNADMYCYLACSNDYALGVQIGTLTHGYTDEVDTDTWLGALEYICRYYISNRVGKQLVFVIPHKTQFYAINANANGDTWQDFHDAAVSCFMKYSIPFYDAYAYSGANGWNSAQSAAYMTANSSGTPDGTHLTEAGNLKFYVGQLYEVLSANIGVTL